jgi:hypothetical protein
MELRKGRDGWDWIIVAMAYRQLGDQEETRKWYDRGVRWMEKTRRREEALRRFRAEAADVLALTPCHASPQEGVEQVEGRAAFSRWSVKVLWDDG